MSTYGALDRNIKGAYFGGAELQQALLARVLNRRGLHRCSVVTACYGQVDGAMVDGIPVYGAYDPTAGLPLIRYFHPRWTGLIRALRRANADAYYVSCAGGNAAHVLTWARATGRAAIFRIASDSDCEAKSPLVSGWAAQVWYAFGLRRAHVVIAQTEKQRELLRANFGIEAVIAPSIHEHPSEPPASQARDIDALWVANLRDLKRPELFVELARRLPAHSFHLVGGAVAGEESVAERLNAIADGVNNLKLYGRLGFLETSALFARARVFINTSTIEGFPNTFLQAWSNGVPVVSFNDPDGVIARERLGHAATDLEDMVVATASLLEDASAWQGASQRAVGYARSRKDADALGGVYEAYIDLALKRARMNHCAPT